MASAASMGYIDPISNYSDPRPADSWDAIYGCKVGDLASSGGPGGTPGSATILGPAPPMGGAASSQGQAAAAQAPHKESNVIMDLLTAPLKLLGLGGDSPQQSSSLDPFGAGTMVGNLLKGG